MEVWASTFRALGFRALGFMALGIMALGFIRDLEGYRVYRALGLIGF